MKRLFWAGTLIPIVAFSISDESRYTQLARDSVITSRTTNGQVVLETPLLLATGADVLLQSDGRFFPDGQNGLAVVEIRVDGRSVSNISALDFRSTAAVEHNYNCIGLTWLAAGSHTVRLVAYNHPAVRSGRFVIGSGSNLSVVVSPATESSVTSLAGDSPYINVKTYPFQPGSTIDHVGVLSTQHTVSQAPLVLLASGRAYTARNTHGDAMWGLLVNNECPSSSEHLWAVNDIAPESYLHVPMWTHAMYDNPPPAAAIQLAATELPYERQAIDNPVRYTVGSSTTMIALSGGMPIHGGVSELRSRPCTPGTYIPAGTGTWTYWTRSFDVTRGQNGNVIFLLKTRVLDCQPNEGPGLVKLQLELDGDSVGSTGIQGFAYNETCHQRTLTASYLALGLSVGRHTIKGRIDTTNLPGLAASGDLGLLYFGN